MNPTFDLLRSPWVPCIRCDGTSDELGLRDVLVRAHELRELGGESPLVTAALHRLLLAVLHRTIQGPTSYDEWANLWDASRWDTGRLDAYLMQWSDHFDLFDSERPFFQAPDERVRAKSAASLIYEAASGNNPTLFDHHTDDGGITLTPAQAARMLVAAQAFGLAGLCAPGLPNFTDGACARSIIFLVQGNNLFETLALNLLPYPSDEIMLHSNEDRPAWEMEDAFSPDRDRPLGYLDYLTWQNRRVQFLPEEMPSGFVVREMTMAPGLRLDSDVLDPLTHYRRDEKHGPLPLAFTEGRALWRDSAALLRLHDKGYQPPRTFAWLAELVYEGTLDRSQTRRYLALGMSKKQAKVNFYRSERMPLPMDYLEQRELVEALEDSVQMAEAVARQLWGAARTLATFVLSPGADADSARKPVREDLDALTDQWAMERRYWPRLELPFLEMMEALPIGRDKALEPWRKTLRRAAWEAFDQVASNLEHDPSKLKAVVRARDQLATGLGKALPEV